MLKQTSKIARMTKIFQPNYNEPKVTPGKSKQPLSKSLKALLKHGVIRPSHSGLYHLLPLGLRSLEKLTRIVDEEMCEIDAQKMLMPSLTHVELWKQSGRLDKITELFTVTDRHAKTYVLNPTHEELITHLIASLGTNSHANFPLGLYQISSKFRDELKPRFGLMRMREFIMKDLYTFDVDVNAAARTYETVTRAYQTIMKRLCVKYVRVEGETGEIGGQLSHEFHFPSEIGEDKLTVCECGRARNVKIMGDAKCPACSSTKSTILNGIEVGHTFLLGDHYSKPLNATFKSKDGQNKHLQMGCYGLGLSRILAAALESLMVDDNTLRWPASIVPYTLVIIPPKDGSKEQKQIGNADLDVYTQLNSALIDVLIDDRTQLTIGKRTSDAKTFGYPYVAVIGKKFVESRQLELIDTQAQTVMFGSVDEITERLEKIVTIERASESHDKCERNHTNGLTGTTVEHDRVRDKMRD